jgi:hypothetical protein
LGQTSIPYLGFVISVDGVSPEPSKVCAIADWPAPQSALALKSFMGGIHFDRRFIAHFSQLARPLHHLGNKIPFVWTPLAQQQFQTLKQELCSAPVLRLPDLRCPLKLKPTDASQYAIGALIFAALMLFAGWFHYHKAAPKLAWLPSHSHSAFYYSFRS